MYMGWYDPDRKKSPAVKAEEAIARYREKFGRHPELVIVGPTTPLEGPVGAPRNRLPVRTVPYIPANTFYVGVEET